MNPRRLEKFRSVAYLRQPDLTVVLENVHDMHNIGAVMRTADSVGITEIFVLYNEASIMRKNLRLGKRTSAGARRWVDVHYYQNTEACFRFIRQKYDLVLGTHLDEESRQLYQLDLTRSTALVFGNEHQGLSKEVLEHCDGNFLVPQVGMVESLNVSVACAVTLYEAFRQRQAIGGYSDNLPQSEAEREERLQEYIRRHEKKIKPKSAPPINLDPDTP